MAHQKLSFALLTVLKKKERRKKERKKGKRKKCNFSSAKNK
jgi:hypothetical protein